MENLVQILGRLDGKGYKAYKELQGKKFYKNGVSVKLTHVQGDPFATPSVAEVTVKNSFPERFFDKRHKRIALEDFLVRSVYEKSSALSFKGGTGHSGKLFVPKPSQAVLQRSSIKITKDSIVVRIFVGLPANGRRINGKNALRLFENIFTLAGQTLFLKNYSGEAIEDVITLSEEQHFIRKKLSEMGLVSFIADGSILPRQSGIDERRLEVGAVPFVSPDSLAVEMSLPGGKVIRGMGIKKGITLIAGGGYHGKTTLLEAIHKGIYNHIRGDGREYVVTDESAVKVRSEDGRSIANVDISNFLQSLPQIKDTEHFSTKDASGSTSMAAAISEAIEMESKLLLFDEDTCATNFMIRDARMQRLVKNEPIIPLIDRLRDLYNDFGISSILVIGGAGDYLDVCDTVIVMERYRPLEQTERAKEIAKEIPSNRDFTAIPEVKEVRRRVLNTEVFLKRVLKEKVKLRGKSILQIGKTEINLTFVEEFVESGQFLASGRALLRIKSENKTDSVYSIVKSLEDCIQENGVECLFSGTVYPTLSEVRRFEIASALNRIFGLPIK